LSLKQQTLFWLVAAIAALAFFSFVVVWRGGPGGTRWSSYMVGDPHQGVHLFESKGCIGCHAIYGEGGKTAPDLGGPKPSSPDLNHLVTALWNHAPAMWEQMKKQSVAVPALTEGEMADLFSYLYIVQYTDMEGSAYRGRQIFESKKCVQCHAVRGEGGKIGPDFTSMEGIDTPIVWAQAMWNHGPAMEEAMRQMDVAWPKFDKGEMNDLLAYVREIAPAPRREFDLLPADPARGRRLFWDKQCISCHSLQGQGGKAAHDLATRGQEPPSLAEFAAQMWNHSPGMWRSAESQGIQRPTFSERQMADLIAMLHTLRYFEPDGSATAGGSLFATLGCTRCHGDDGGGTSLAPALRNRGGKYTSVTLAAALWKHGPAMYQRMREQGRAWPQLKERELPDLMAYLNQLSGNH